MKYSKLAETYALLEETSSTLKKVSILSELFSNTPGELLHVVAYLAMGEVFPPWDKRELNMADKLSMDAIARVTGSNRAEVTQLLKREGDLGSAAAGLLKDRKQSTLSSRELTVAGFYDSLQKIASAEGPGSVDRKVDTLSELLSNASPREARYIVRTVLGQLRIGVGEGIVRDAIAKTFGVPPGKVERAHAILNDYGEVAELASKGEGALDGVKLKIGRPLKAMLYPKVDSIEEAIEKAGLPIQAEFKYDGFRTQIHKSGDDVKVFTRRLDDVTRQFPDIVRAVKEGVTAGSVVFDSESVGMDPETGKFVPFQKISQRIRRKHGISRMAEEVPVKVHLFDVIFLEGENFIDRPLGERFELLKGAFRETDDLKLVDFVRAKDEGEVEKLYEEALSEGAEGLMLKNVGSPYKPGQRVGYGYKLKPEAETLDLVVIGAEWGEGKRASWLSSYLLGARDEETGRFLPVGKMATGMTEQDLQNLTEAMEPLVQSEKGKRVRLKPEIVLEVGYQEIQRSPTYGGGFALRFPRMVRIRDDKCPEEADTIERVKQLFRSQH